MRIEIRRCACGNDFRVVLGIRGRKPSKCEACRTVVRKPVEPYSIARKCKTCGKEFGYLVTQQTRKLPVYCSPECRPSFRPPVADRKINSREPKPDNVCVQCGATWPKTVGRPARLCPACRQTASRITGRRTVRVARPLSGEKLAIHLDAELRAHGTHISQHRTEW